MYLRISRLGEDIDKTLNEIKMKVKNSEYDRLISVYIETLGKSSYVVCNVKSPITLSELNEFARYIGDYLIMLV